MWFSPLGLLGGGLKQGPVCISLYHKNFNSKEAFPLILNDPQILLYTKLNSAHHLWVKPGSVHCLLSFPFSNNSLIAFRGHGWRRTFLANCDFDQAGLVWQVPVCSWCPGGRSRVMMLSKWLNCWQGGCNKSKSNRNIGWLLFKHNREFIIRLECDFVMWTCTIFGRWRYLVPCRGVYERCWHFKWGKICGSMQCTLTFFLISLAKPRISRWKSSMWI